MFPSTLSAFHRWSSQFRRVDRQRFFSIVGVFLLFVLMGVEFGVVNNHQVQANSFDHTVSTVNGDCRRVYYASDGNPYPLCPGPYPSGGNCTWWPWEMWHLLGYNLPRNWGAPDDWVVDAERTGLPVGTTPRVASIAVFPVADGVWAFGSNGHAAFVTKVGPDGSSFNVTYQNYGDPTPMHVGIGYNASVINERRFQNGHLRFIYFPWSIKVQLFSHLPGINGNDISGVASANQLLANGSNGNVTLPGTRVALGLAPSSSDQEFNADFTGTGLSDLLLYNRQKGSLDVLSLSNNLSPAAIKSLPRLAANEIMADPNNAPMRVSLADAIHSVNGWGSSLDVHVGDFTGTGESEILLYNRVTGTLEFISFTPQLTIKKHVVLSGWGPGWELSVVRLDGNRSGILMYNRVVNAPPIQGTPPTATQETNPPANPTQGVTPTPTVIPSPTSTPTPTATPKPTPTPTPSPTARPSPTTKPTPTPTPSPTARPSPTASPTATRGLDMMLAPKSGPDQGGALDADVSNLLGEGAAPQGLTANVMVLDFDRNFNVLHLQQYTLIDTSWEVYIGRFVNSHRDGVFLYDRTLGEARIMSFDSELHLSHFQKIHHLEGNWEVYSGDFKGSGRAQVLLYDPGSGEAQFLTFASDLSLADQKSYPNWGTNQVLYVGHFGLPQLSVMLYNPEAAKSTFIAFNASLDIVHQFTVQSWDQSFQILIGAFLDHSRCLAAHNCSTGDDILVLDRRTGQIQQYIFSFGREYSVYDNRSQGYVRNGASDAHLNPVKTTIFKLMTTLDTDIKNEELY